MVSISQHFARLTRTQILALRPGAWGDYELLDVRKDFEDQRDRHRALAVVELILCSSEHSELLNYGELYDDLVQYFAWEGDFSAALRWAHVWLAYVEQHAEHSLNRANARRALAETYLRAGDFDIGLGLFSRQLRSDPTDVWIHNVLGLTLPDVGLSPLALEVLERGLGLVAQRDPQGLLGQFTRLRQGAVEGSASWAGRMGDISPVVLAEFRMALALNAEPRPADAPEPYLPPITQLLDLGPQPDASAFAAVRAYGKVLIPELIRLAFDEERWRSSAPAHAVALLREMHDSQAAELGGLAAWLERATADWLDELLAERCGKVGGYTTGELQAIAADTGCGDHARDSAVRALVERAQRLPSQRPAIIAFLQSLLNRPEAQAATEETFAGLLIGNLLDLDAREAFPDIQRGFAEDRVDLQIVDLSSVHHRWGLPSLLPPRRRSDGLYLLLRCTACGRGRTHFVQQVLVDVNTLDKKAKGEAISYDPYIMDREIICPKCGAVDRYEMTSAAHLRLVGSENLPAIVESMVKGRKPKTVEFQPPKWLHPFRSSVFGRPMHPLDGLAEYRRRIEINPNDAQLHLKLGNLLRTIYRSQAALAEHRRAYTLDPNHAEIALACGMSEHDFGDKAAAKACYERAARLELQGKGLLGIVRSDTLAGAAFEGLGRLKRGLSSPAYTATDAEPVEPGEKVVRPRRKRGRGRRKGR